MGFFVGLIIKEIMDIMLKIIKKVLEFFIGLMGRNLKDFGKKENNMILGIFLLIKLVNMENGMKEDMLKL